MLGSLDGLCVWLRPGPLRSATMFVGPAQGLAITGVECLLVPEWLGEVLSALVFGPHQAERPQGPDVLVRRESPKGSTTFPTLGFFDVVIAADRISFPMLFKMVIRLGGQGSKSVHTQAILMNSLEEERGKWYCLFCFS